MHIVLILHAPSICMVLWLSPPFSIWYQGTLVCIIQIVVSKCSTPFPHLHWRIFDTNLQTPNLNLNLNLGGQEVLKGYILTL
mmetsp:Transcript_70516/g.118217  ORF Transcript_70516/g.118217 Transcript_70516/m.118217 type:complete len:82 (+) Transcript_70516:565-810(+)